MAFEITDPVAAGIEFKFIITSSVEGVQAVLLIVHLKEYVVPGNPVKVEVAPDGDPIEPPAPLTILHVPVPDIGVLPVKVAAVPQIF